MTRQEIEAWADRGTAFTRDVVDDGPFDDLTLIAHALRSAYVHGYVDALTNGDLTQAEAQERSTLLSVIIPLP